MIFLFKKMVRSLKKWLDAKSLKTIILRCSKKYGTRTYVTRLKVANQSLGKEFVVFIKILLKKYQFFIKLQFCQLSAVEIFLSLCWQFLYLIGYSVTTSSTLSFSPFSRIEGGTSTSSQIEIEHCFVSYLKN